MNDGVRPKKRKHPIARLHLVAMPYSIINLSPFPSFSLEEKWNEAAQALLDVGGKLWAAYHLIDRDQVGLFKLVVPEEGENLGNWNWNDLSDRAKEHSIEALLMM